jgi:hypothetical protein
MKTNKIRLITFALAALVFLMLGVTKCENFQRFDTIENKQDLAAKVDTAQYEIMASKLDSATRAAVSGAEYARKTDSLLRDTVSFYKELLLQSDLERELMAEREILQARHLKQLAQAMQEGQRDFYGVIAALSDTLGAVRSEVRHLRDENQLRQQLLVDSLRFTARIVRSMEDSLNSRYKRQSATTVAASSKKKNHLRSVRRKRQGVRKSVPTNGLFDLFRKRK